LGRLSPGLPPPRGGGGGGWARARPAPPPTAAYRGGFDITVDIDDKTQYHYDEILYRVAQELLINIVKHAQATRVTVSLAATADLVRLVVTDNGIGLNARTVNKAREEGHIGLASHRLRVQDAGGTFSLVSAPGEGATAEVLLPLPSEGSPGPG
ncbi:sensor histidine kinase, partial [Streptomyces vinaceus]|uniref:sensor histidine kinase n=1 Tax=Streptomyces vinaceus TaxID=1960 RepID=UPI0035D6DE23